MLIRPKQIYLKCDQCKIHLLKFVFPLLFYIADETSVDEAISVGYDGDALNNESAAVKVVRMPEFLTVCGWRCVKEVSLLLGYLVESAPVIDIATASPGLLTINQVSSCCNDILCHGMSFINVIVNLSETMTRQLTVYISTRQFCL